MPIDQNLFFIFYNLAGKSTLGDFLIVFFGEYFFYAILFVFAFFLYKNWQGNIQKIYPHIISVLAAIFARFVVATLIRFFYHRPRPFLALELPHLIQDSAYSFPSGHTIFVFALATVTYFFNKKLAYFLYISGIIIGFARVAGGVHYPSDILGGVILGIFVGLIIYTIYKNYAFCNRSAQGAL